MYRVYEMCKANETQSGHFVQTNRIIILSDYICGTKFENRISVAVILWIDVQGISQAYKYL